MQGSARRATLKAKRLLARALCAPVVGRFVSLVYGDEIPSRGCVITVDGRIVRASTRASLFWGLYESAEVRFVQRHLRGDEDVVELGSSLGVLAAHVARKLAPGRRLICVEPDGRLLDGIRRNVLRNAPGTPLTVLQRAVDYSHDGAGLTTLVVGQDNIHSRLGTPRDGEMSAQVQRARLSDIVEEARVSRYALVCDIEGAEAGIILEDEATLRACQQLIIELHDTSYAGRRVSVDEMRELLEKRHGFSPRGHYGPVGVYERP